MQTNQIPKNFQIPTNFLGHNKTEEFAFGEDLMTIGKEPGGLSSIPFPVMKMNLASSFLECLLQENEKSLFT